MYKEFFDPVWKPIRSIAVSLMVFSAAVNVLMLAGPLYMLQVYDRVLTTGHVETLVVLSLMLGCAFLALAALDGLRSLVLGRAAAKIEQTLQPAVLERTIELASQSSTLRSAQSLRDLATLRSFIGSSLSPFLDLPFLPLFYGILFLIHPLIGWLVLVGGGIGLMLAILNDTFTQEKTRLATTQSMKMLAQADAIVRNSDSIRAMGFLDHLQVQRHKQAIEAEQAHQDAADTSAIFGALGRFIRYALQSAVLGMAAWLVIKEQMSSGSIIAATILSARALAPVEQVIASWRQVHGVHFACKRLGELFHKIPSQGIRIALPPPRGDVLLERVVWSPTSSQSPVIRGISLSFRAGETISIIGPSGSGKTTLMKLIAGALSPSSGTIRMDGADLRQINASDRFRYIGYLSQDIELFPGTVRDNICRFSGAEDGEVLSATLLSGAHQTILELPQGYETLIGEGGHPLSGGQRQRIGLARALFGHPVLVILDEPNSSLDAVGEQALNAAIAHLRKRNVTVLMVTQRTAALNFADHILMIRDGQVESFGQRDEMLKRIRPNPVPAPSLLPRSA